MYNATNQQKDVNNGDQIKRVQWRVQVDGTIYGPYPRARLIDFLREGRVNAHTLLACGEDDVFFRADEHPNIRWNFSGNTENTARIASENKDEDQAPTVCNYFISGRILTNLHHFEQVLNAAGKFARAGNDMWVLRSNITLPQLRNKLSAVMGKDEQFVIVNATKGRLAWFNLGVEPDIAVRSVWDSDLDD
ncbi:hypothetical protein [Hirschia baltica]|uniref:GYF domain-containing protein n=1 Tax=Hirschia baltica (strain ATCC 49814 / DSM 5838 / IFAM 1418) TaxID=582402 RepID=C6XNU4_HIRBI|nr:hypothetical protein [Hirschia baltica]ACT58347.1 hypothetical protein Hbal_0645 [Hirschia baltica ATCC 49814]